MHLLGSADDGINRTGLNTERAAYAELFVYQCYGTFAFKAVDGIDRNDWLAKHMCQSRDAFHPTRRALVVAGAAVGHGFCVRATGRIAALGALRLWQQIFKAIGERVDVVARQNNFGLRWLTVESSS